MAAPLQGELFGKDRVRFSMLIYARRLAVFALAANILN
jgi:hypothetical protein